MVYRPGKTNIADALSRLNSVDQKDHSCEDADFVRVIVQVVTRGIGIVIPQSRRSEVLRLAHEGYQGIGKMKNRLRSKVWWPKMDRDAVQVCKSCHGTQVVREIMCT